MVREEWIGDCIDAVGILRVSSHRQKDNISHDTQESEIRAYCESVGINLVRLEKIVESAKDFECRKKYTAAMTHALAEGIRHICFYMYDREARNLTDNERNEKYVKSGLVVLHYVRDKRVLHKDSSDSDFFIRDVHAATSKQYSRAQAVKVNDSMRRKAEDGWYPSNRPPLGYVVTRAMKDSSGEIQKSKIAYTVRDPDERRVKWVQREFELRAQSYSFQEICRITISEGLVSDKDARGYRPAAVEYRIKNPFYEGYFLWKGRRYKGNHELIIPLRTLTLARQSPGWVRKPKIGQEHGLFGRGWMRCAECGCLITYDPKTRLYRNGVTSTFHYYRCANGKRVHTNMVGRNISEQSIWDQFDRVIDRITITPEIAKRIADALNVSERKAAQGSLKSIERIKTELADLTKREDRAYEDMLAGFLDGDAFKRQRDRIRSDRMRLTEALEAAKVQIQGKYSESMSTIIELATMAKDLYNSRSPQEKKEFLENVVSNPRLMGATVEYDLKKTWLMLLDLRGVG